MKGIGKAISRTPFTVTSKIGMAKKSSDPEFEEYQRNFASLETATEKMLKDTKAFIESVNRLFTSGASFATHFSTVFTPIATEYDLIGKHPECGHTIRNVAKYEATMEELRGSVGPELELIDSRIVGPTKEFQGVLKLIRKTITKRDHKLTDYDRFNNSLTKLRDKKEKSLSDEKNLFKLEQDFEMATNEYEFINNALKEDLPRFMTMAGQFIDPLFNSFYYMQLNIFYLLLEKMNGFTEEAQVDAANMSGSQIERDYESKRTDAWQRIEDLNIVKRIISVSKLVQATRAQNGTGVGRSASTTSSASSSTLGVNGRLPPPSRSPSGNPPLKKAPPPPPPSAGHAPPPPYTAMPSKVAPSSSSAPAKRAPPPPPPLKPKPKPVAAPKYVTALYDFTAQADGDLSFRTGDRIEIVKRTPSSEDWWTGRLNGQEGVFPGNYVQDE
ncbi:BAR-domain-containing protein [Pluteus cervinus]|uniref:BAR-domain-containing protein n=1 Tax=Pluteus cervinus TaxID=181527 RepID=A0ACD3BEW9_9AGAR|nr:BAR-domain-containing protein [Pluteus cervinus]